MRFLFSITILYALAIAGCKKDTDTTVANGKTVIIHYEAGDYKEGDIITFTTQPVLDETKWLIGNDMKALIGKEIRHAAFNGKISVSGNLNGEIYNGSTLVFAHTLYNYYTSKLASKISTARTWKQEKFLKRPDGSIEFTQIYPDTAFAFQMATDSSVSNLSCTVRTASSEAISIRSNHGSYTYQSMVGLDFIYDAVNDKIIFYHINGWGGSGYESGYRFTSY